MIVGRAPDIAWPSDRRFVSWPVNVEYVPIAIGAGSEMVSMRQKKKKSLP